MLWRERRLRHLLELIDGLPEASRLNEAIQNDPERAEILADLERERGVERGREWSPRIRDFDLHALMLREVVNSLQAIQSTIVGTTYVPEKNGSIRFLKPRKGKPFPAPVTALDTVKARRSRQSQLSIIRAFAPTHYARMTGASGSEDPADD